jgi:hypothetical protein
LKDNRTDHSPNHPEELPDRRHHVQIRPDPGAFAAILKHPTAFWNQCAAITRPIGSIWNHFNANKHHIAADAEPIRRKQQRDCGDLLQDRRDPEARQEGEMSSYQELEPMRP